MQPLVQDGHAGANCDFILAGEPRWQFTWNDRLAVDMVWPRSSAEMICHLVEPGRLPFERITVRRVMQWRVADAM
jgi:hypothetical protein